MPFLKIFPKKFLGIDIGTSSIKIVELGRFAGRKKLENYGEISASALYQKPFRTFEKNTLLLSTGDISQAVKAILEESKIKSRESIFSIPDFSTFFTNIELPPMTKQEIPEAVMAEARKQVPIPLSETTLDWQLISEGAQQKNVKKLRVLLVAVPNEIINQYQQIALLSNLKLAAMEAEVFGSLRSLIEKEEKRVVSIIDMGARTTTCSIIENGLLKDSHSFDLSGDDLTERVQKGLSMDYETAENLKRKYGLSGRDSGTEARDINEIISPLLGAIFGEIERVFKNFYLSENKKVDKIILAGGTALMPGLLEYFRNYFKIETEIADPFSKIFYPPILEKTLKDLGPSYAIAMGMALRGLEY